VGREAAADLSNERPDSNFTEVAYLETTMNGKRLCVGAIAAIVGCASGASGTSGTSATPRSSSILSAEQIGTLSPEGRTAYDLVTRFRPKWLLARGVQPRLSASDSSEYALVVVDGHPTGRIGALRDIEAYQVVDMRYYDIGEAGAKFGERGASGIIEVRLRAPRQ
jgi:hypothetical protein